MGGNWGILAELDFGGFPQIGLSLAWLWLEDYMGLHCVAMPRSGTTLFASENFDLPSR